MEFVSYGSFTPKGDIEKRLLLSDSRMHSERYDPEAFLTQSFSDNADWPGDHEGRLLLALVMLSRALGKKSENIEILWQKISMYMNDDGYMGPKIDENNINEQSLSGNSWLMRGLCEWYEWEKREDVYAAIKKMAEGLFLKTLGKYRQYPMEKHQRLQGAGAEAGSLTGESASGWLPSTDIGCAFIMTDGVSHAYRILKTDALYSLLIEMIEMFSSADLSAGAFQTHASLSATRGILRAYTETGNENWLREAEKQYAYYLENGMTENYANHNWYTRPEWTEPCAIVDSLILSGDLWRLTGKKDYLDNAYRIYFNAITRSQRPNGGFGCDNCLGAFGKVLTNRSYEAWWCCTMRGGDGLANASRMICAVKDDVIYIPFYHEGEVKTNGLSFKIETHFPGSGKINIGILESDGREHTLAFFKPAFADAFSVNGNEALKEENGFVFIRKTFAEGESIVLEMSFGVKTADASAPAFPGAKTILYGAVMLGTDARNGETALPNVNTLTLKDEKTAAFEDECGRLYLPLGSLTYTDEKTVCESKIQAMFV